MKKIRYAFSLLGMFILSLFTALLWPFRKPIQEVRHKIRYVRQPRRRMTVFMAAYALLLLFCLLALPAVAGTGNADFGITNAAFAGSATFTATGSSVADCSHQDYCSLVFRGTVITSNAVPTATLLLARVDSEGHIEGTNRISWPVNLAIGGDAGTFVTNSLVVGTNLTSTSIGAWSGLKLVSVTTANMTGAATIVSPVLKEELKTIRREN